MIDVAPGPVGPSRAYFSTPACCMTGLILVKPDAGKTAAEEIPDELPTVRRCSGPLQETTQPCRFGRLGPGRPALHGRRVKGLEKRPAKKPKRQPQVPVSHQAQAEQQFFHPKATIPDRLGGFMKPGRAGLWPVPPGTCRPATGPKSCQVR